MMSSSVATASAAMANEAAFFAAMTTTKDASSRASGFFSPPTMNFNIPRALESNDNDGQGSYLVDGDGNAYDAYSLAWRYLGMYIDCDVDDANSDISSYVGGDDVYRKQRKNRKLNSGDDGDDCSRKVLWAAYRDPGYKDGEIGEYQYYDWRTDTWDKSTCQTNRCAKMDCHAKRSHFQLVGVFKETDGLVDWAEQLIKHEGYCVWNERTSQDDGDGEESHDGQGDDDDDGDYDFMYNKQGNFAEGCTAMYLTDDYGNSLYRDIMPQSGGKITDGLYWDEDCTQKASMTFADYIVLFYASYYYDEDTGYEVAQQWKSNMARWNSLMKDFGLCQPCRAYTRHINYDGDGSNDHRHGRLLGDDDGEGSDEKWGYNCYDDAGYENVDQCYKFETQTDMEPATTEDLQRASAQGTILSIKVDGKTYGKGGYHWSNDEAKTVLYILLALALMGLGVLSLRRCKMPGMKGISAACQKCRSRVRSRRFHSGLRKAFFDEDDDEDHLKAEISKRQIVIEQQQQEMEQMKLEMDQEYAIKNVELQQARAQDSGKAK
ncbi:MAG: hypothetical protein SGARI_002576, partial [Bacillariaceae sp.]